jgi:hypothetical protein
VSIKPGTLDSKERPSETLAISVRDNLRTSKGDDEELDMEIIEREDVERDKFNKNMIGKRCALFNMHFIL